MRRLWRLLTCCAWQRVRILIAPGNWRCPRCRARLAAGYCLRLPARVVRVHHARNVLTSRQRISCEFTDFITRISRIAGPAEPKRPA